MTGAWILFIFVASISVSFLLILRYTPAGILLDRHIPDTSRWRILLAAISFFLTFATVRALTWSIHNATTTFIWAVATTSIIWWGASCSCSSSAVPG